LADEVFGDAARIKCRRAQVVENDGGYTPEGNEGKHGAGGHEHALPLLPRRSLGNCHRFAPRKRCRRAPFRVYEVSWRARTERCPTVPVRPVNGYAPSDFSGAGISKYTSAEDPGSPVPAEPRDSTSMQFYWRDAYPGKQLVRFRVTGSRRGACANP